MRTQQKTLWCLGIAIAVAGIVQAQVPPDIAKTLVAIGRGVCVPETSKVYRPLHPNPPYKGIAIARDISFGPDPKDVLDVFSPEKGGGSRPVLIYVSGGAGNKLQGGPNGDVFYDNIMLWAVKNGMTGVNMQRHPGEAWDDPAKAVALVVQWVGQNISRYKGNPDRVFMWSQSAGNGPASTYVGHPGALWPQGSRPQRRGVHVVAGIQYSSARRLQAQADSELVMIRALPGNGPLLRPGSRTRCGKGDGKAPDGKGGADGKGGPAQPDAATQLARSNLPGLINSKLSFFVSAADSIRLE